MSNTKSQNMNMQKSSGGTVDDKSTNMNQSAVSTVKLATDKITDLYHSVEKPVQNTVKSVSDMMPASMKGMMANPMVRNMLYSASLSLLSWVAYRIFRPSSVRK